MKFYHGFLPWKNAVNYHLEYSFRRLQTVLLTDCSFGGFIFFGERQSW